jgi:hypothetical protein
MAADQSVAAAIPAAQDATRKIQRRNARRAWWRARCVLGLAYLNKGGTNVDLSLRLNVLAVCAVFVFVGAIVLGAF